MRVLLVVGRFPEPSQTFIAAHLTGLLDRGVDAHVLCSVADPAAWERFPGLAQLARGRVHVHSPRERTGPTLHGLASRRAGVPAKRLALAVRGQPPGRAARRLLLAARVLGLAPDLIHFEFGADAAGAMWLGDVAGCPVVVSLRGYDVNYEGLGEPGFYADVWARADAVHCLGADLWRRARQRGCPPSLLHRLIPPAVDTARFVPAGRREHDRLVLLTVARLHWKKGYEHGLQAVRALLDDGIDLEYRILGGGPHEDAVRACVDDLGLGEHVRLLGDRPTDDVLAELQAADVLLHPAVSEGFGNAVLEAQAVQLPVVCTDADGLRENVVDGVTGIVVPRRDVAALVAAVRALAGDPELRRRMGAAGRRHVAAHFSPESQSAAFLELYDAVQVSEARPAPARRAPARSL
jgi:colanic acid/amylovoran biosynthesis glycosyltransferase